jgi:hypothetical protein
MQRVLNRFRHALYQRNRMREHLTKLIWYSHWNRPNNTNRQRKQKRNEEGKLPLDNPDRHLRDDAFR